MSAAEWGAVALFAAVAIGLSIIDGELATGLVIVVGLVIVLTTFTGTTFAKV